MIHFLNTPPRKRSTRTIPAMPKVQPVHGRRCICHRCIRVKASK